MIISAIGSPLDDGAGEVLHEEGLAAHLDDQWSHGIDGVLVAGSMGAMQLLRDETYDALCRRAADLSRGRGEILIGAGDCSFARTRARVEFLNTLAIDGVVVLPPFFFRFSQQELIDYYQALADVSRAPLYLYDLPQRTGSKIELATVVELSRHPNICGVKCSDDPAYARALRQAAADDFRVVVAQAGVVDALLREGFDEHLDGMFAIAPAWTTAIARCASRGEWAAAADYQQRLNALRDQIVRFDPLPAMTAVLNARGIPGNFAPRPFRSLDPSQRATLLNEPAVIDLLEGDNFAAAVATPVTA